jgi:Ni/Fe-hydrogenase subunit HybB-like protein
MSVDRINHRLGFWKGMFYLLVAIGLVLTVVRYTKGLGAVTNLSDRYPWGLWKAFNVLVGVGLGGAGFTLMGVSYIFNAKRFRPIVRPAVVMAFLAYTSAAVALMIDIGRSWAIWHPIVMWNPHSVLFEVAWCLMLYTGVLVLEGSGMLFERLGWHRLVHIQHTATVPIVIAGVMLSTLHQSSLGSLFLIAPGKLHPIWYTSMLPLLFFISAICVGLAMLIIMSRLSAHAFGRQFDVPLLGDLSRILVAMLGVYGLARIWDLTLRGQLGTAFGWGYEPAMFQLEFGLGVVAPLALLVWPKLRANWHVLYGGAMLAVFGFVMNRMNVAITGFEGAQGGRYVPSWEEVFMTLMVVALVFGGFGLAVKHLPVFPDVGAAKARPVARAQAGSHRFSAPELN